MNGSESTDKPQGELIKLIGSFLSRSRCRALALKQPIPVQVSGVCLFADISGFTPLTESLGGSLGAQQGAEVLTGIINDVFDRLINQVHHFGGDVLGFAGDAITCWFADDVPARPTQTIQQAAACAQAMQIEMQPFSAVPTPTGSTHLLTMKVGLAYGPAQWLLVGRPEYGQFDLITGPLLMRVAAAEHHAEKGEIICAPEVAFALAGAAEWGDDREGFRVLCGLNLPQPLSIPAAPLPDFRALTTDMLRPYFPRALFDWLVRYGGTSQTHFIAELRPVVSAFMRFDGLDYDQDPRVTEKLNQYVGTAQELAARYGGSVIRLDYGDKGSVLHIVFGAPVAHEELEIRAVGWSVEMQSAVRQFPYITGQHIGMTRGQVYAGALGALTRRGYTLMGDEVNASARLMQAAQTGQTLVSQGVMLAAQKRFMFHQFPGFQVKGKFEPVPVATPVAPLPPMPQMMVGGNIVGRESEIALLEDALDALVSGQRQVLCIEGDTGLGKTRLMADLLQKAMARGVRTLVGNAVSTGRSTPYYPWREILNLLFGLQPAWPAVQQAMQIQTMLTWINPEWIPRVPLLGDLLGLQIPDTPMTAGFDAHMRHESLKALLNDLLVRMAMQQPLLILLEDCHWADDASLALLASLARGLGEARLMLVATYRPSDDPDRPVLPALAGARHMNLAELSPAAVQALITARLGAELPIELLGLIQERAQGNPLFIEELTETIRETSKLQSVGSQWVLASTGAMNRLPDTIQGVVLARLDRLDVEPRLTIAVASVAGHTFEVDLIQAVHPAQARLDSLKNQMQVLAKRSFVERENPEPQLTYRFRQNVTREVAYNTLLYGQRRVLHHSVAAWYESVRTDSLSAIYPLLVHHYHGAEDTVKECQYASLAGEMAARQYANLEALRYLGRALELTPPEDTAARLRLLLQREKVYDVQAERELQAQDLTTIQALAQQSVDARAIATWALRQANYAEVVSDYPQAVAHLEQTVKLSQQAQDVETETTALLQWGRVLWQQGNYPESAARLTEAHQRAAQSGLRSLEASCLLNLGFVASSQGNVQLAHTHLEAALAIYRELGDPMGEAKALSNLGIVYSDLNEWEQARLCHKQSLRLRRSIGDRMGESIALFELGVLSDEQGDAPEALKLYSSALEISRKIGNRRNEAIILNNMAYVLMRLGDFAAAQASLEKSLSIKQSLGNQGAVGYTLTSLALLQLRTGAISQAGQAAQQALEIAMKKKDRSLEGLAATLLGHAQMDLDQPALALPAYQQAVEAYSTLERHNPRMEALAGIASVCLKSGQLQTALEQVEVILHHLESSSLEGADEPLRVYLTCYRVLSASQDPRSASLIERSRQTLLEQAEQITEPARRQAFLGIALHRAILQAAEQTD